MRRDVLGQARKWLEKAEVDFRTIDILMAHPEPPSSSVCFHAQQAAEKLLKALLTATLTPFPKTHDLARLASLLPAPAQLDIETDTWLELSYYAVDSRYPDDLAEYTQELAHDLWQKARAVKRAVEAKVEFMGAR
jgi:HEPN domain-containing protein